MLRILDSPSVIDMLSRKMGKSVEITHPFRIYPMRPDVAELATEAYNYTYDPIGLDMPSELRENI